MEDLINLLLGQEGILAPMSLIVNLLLVLTILMKLKKLAPTILSKKTTETPQELQEIVLKLDAILQIQKIVYEDNINLGEIQKAKVLELVKEGIFASQEKIKSVLDELEILKEKNKELLEAGANVIDGIKGSITGNSTGKDL